MSVTPSDEDLIATAIGWAKQYPELGVPDDLTAADGEVHTRVMRSHIMESSGPLEWIETEWTVILRDRWAVDLDTMGVPKGPPRRRR